MSDEQVVVPAVDPAPAVAPVVDPTPVVAPVVDPAPAVAPTPVPESVAHSQSLLNKFVADLEASKAVVAIEQAKQKALLAVVSETKAGFDKLHSELSAITTKVVTVEKDLVVDFKKEEQLVKSWTVEHTAKAVVIAVAIVIVGWFVVTQL